MSTNSKKWLIGFGCIIIAAGCFKFFNRAIDCSVAEDDIGAYLYVGSKSFCTHINGGCERIGSDGAFRLSRYDWAKKYQKIKNEYIVICPSCVSDEAYSKLIVLKNEFKDYQTNRKKLYTNLSQEYDLGDYESFCKDLDDADKRRKLYDAVSEDYELGDYNTYEEWLGYKNDKLYLL